MQRILNASLIMVSLAITPLGHSQVVTADYAAQATGHWSSAGRHDRLNPNYLTGRISDSNPLNPVDDTYAGFAVIFIPGVPYKTIWTEKTTISSSWLRAPSLDGPSPLGSEYTYAWRAIDGVERHDTYIYHTWLTWASGTSLTLNFTSPGSQTSTGLPLTVFDVSTPVSTLVSYDGAPSVFNDLTSGLVYGATIPPDGPFSISLNEHALNALAALPHYGGGFVVGFALPGASDNEYVFGFTGNPIGISLSVSGEQTLTTDTPTFYNNISYYEMDRYWTDGSHSTPLFGMNQDLWYTNDPNSAPGFMAVPEPQEFAVIASIALLVVGCFRRMRA